MRRQFFRVMALNISLSSYSAIVGLKSDPLTIQVEIMFSFRI